MKHVAYVKGDQIMFHCPGCDDLHAPNTSWTFNGNLEKPTLSPSILVTRNYESPAGNRCHSYVREGRIQFLTDCTNHLSGQTVDLPEFPEKWK